MRLALRLALWFVRDRCAKDDVVLIVRVAHALHCLRGWLEARVLGSIHRRGRATEKQIAADVRSAPFRHKSWLRLSPAPGAEDPLI